MGISYDKLQNVNPISPAGGREKERESEMQLSVMRLFIQIFFKLFQFPIHFPNCMKGRIWCKWLISAIVVVSHYNCLPLSLMICLFSSRMHIAIYLWWRRFWTHSHRHIRKLNDSSAVQITIGLGSYSGLDCAAALVAMLLSVKDALTVVWVCRAPKNWLATIYHEIVYIYDFIMLLERGEIWVDHINRIYAFSRVLWLLLLHMKLLFMFFYLRCSLSLFFIISSMRAITYDLHNALSSRDEIRLNS